MFSDVLNGETLWTEGECNWYGVFGISHEGRQLESITFWRVLTMVYNTELLGFWTLSIVRYSRKIGDTTFRKLDLFPSSGKGGKTPTQLSPLERVQWLILALSKGPNWVGVFPPLPEDGNRSSFRNVVSSIFLEYRTMEKVTKNPVILCSIN
jgi:hypothetical protein